eukprot:CAMPEP_0169413402 /NCGR_PEP_ID=MMETSP1017-20121227/61334_1 /TAXON_ID=342587 /ORGANISM="Karlodinium micrum, Strain CCMP2283" /LENGTH=230 /DNA_ID=CAMNT_0009520809 /DNA_START=570 /DNA_END=1265 /DNA_ORIENTATION=-
MPGVILALLLGSTATEVVAADNGRFNPDSAFGAPATLPVLLSVAAQELERSACAINCSSCVVGGALPTNLKLVMTHRRLGGVKRARISFVLVASSFHFAMKSAICRSSAEGPAALAAATPAGGADFGWVGLSPEIGPVELFTTANGFIAALGAPTMPTLPTGFAAIVAASGLCESGIHAAPGLSLGNSGYNPSFFSSSNVGGSSAPASLLCASRRRQSNSMSSSNHWRFL